MKKLSIFLLFLTFTSFSTGQTVSLPDFSKEDGFFKILENRRSTRDFSSQKLPLNLISEMLWAAFGVNRPDGKRTAPSAVNAQEIDIYVAMESGLYLYDPKNHRLNLVKKKDVRKYTGRQKITEIAPVNLIYVADFSKMGGKESTKRIDSAADTGFISQNVYLYCSYRNLSTVVIGWLDREKLKREMGLSSNRHVTYTQPVGYGKK